jgi:hypothetical protein
MTIVYGRSDANRRTSPRSDSSATPRDRSIGRGSPPERGELRHLEAAGRAPRGPEVRRRRPLPRIAARSTSRPPRSRRTRGARACPSRASARHARAEAA